MSVVNLDEKIGEKGRQRSGMDRKKNFKHRKKKKKTQRSVPIVVAEKEQMKEWIEMRYCTLSNIWDNE